MPPVSRDIMPPAIDHTDMRSAGPGPLSLALMDARNHTLHLLNVFEQAQPRLVVPQRVGLEVPAWLAGHIAWQAEYWIGRNPQRHLGPLCPADTVRLASVDARSDACFDPSLAPREQRWSLALPGSQALRTYLLETLESTLELLEKAPQDDAGLYFFRMALFHEDLRGEQFLTMAQTLGVPVKLAVPASPAPREPVRVPAGQWMLGAQPGGFVFDVQKWSHPVDVPEFEIDAQPVNWSQYVEFAADGGYDDPQWWLPEGWEWLQAELEAAGRRAPRHVDQMGVASGAVMQTLFGRPTRRPGEQAVSHVSWWEADAWCRWAGRRLPTEVEWEMAAHVAGRRGFHWGEVHEWTASMLRPWPGFAPDAWTRHTDLEATALFGLARVLRGASFATRARLKSPKARGFALPERDDLFVGFRSCAA
jgi:ergothioneine biosynthesis protein EgtB